LKKRRRKKEEEEKKENELDTSRSNYPKKWYIYKIYINIAMFSNNFKRERDHIKKGVFHTSSSTIHISTHMHILI
jgi:hypothetical protein